MAPTAATPKRRLVPSLLAKRFPLGEAGDPPSLKDHPAQRRRVPVPIGIVLPTLGLIVCVDRMAHHATVDMQRCRRLVTPAQVGTTLAGWEGYWESGTGSLPTAKARTFLADLRALEETLAAVGL